jgi:hypothetical protein
MSRLLCPQSVRQRWRRSAATEQLLSPDATAREKCPVQDERSPFEARSRREGIEEIRQMALLSLYVECSMRSKALLMIVCFRLRTIPTPSANSRHSQIVCVQMSQVRTICSADITMMEKGSNVLYSSPTWSNILG